jgi:hypothetical protein
LSAVRAVHRCSGTAYITEQTHHLRLFPVTWPGGHIDHGKTTLTAAITKVFGGGEDVIHLRRSG